MPAPKHVGVMHTDTLGWLMMKGDSFDYLKGYMAGRYMANAFTRAPDGSWGPSGKNDRYAFEIVLPEERDRFLFMCERWNLDGRDILKRAEDVLDGNE